MQEYNFVETAQPENEVELSKDYETAAIAMQMYEDKVEGVEEEDVVRWLDKLSDDELSHLFKEFPNS